MVQLGSAPHARERRPRGVVIVPAGGIQSPEIDEAIRSFLQKHALLAVQVTVDPFIEKRFSLSITVRIKTDEFVAEEVAGILPSPSISG